MKRPDPLVLRGLTAGLLAATAVVAWFLALDLLAGSPFRTPAFLAGALFGTEPAAVGSGLIAVYTALHYIVFLILGIGMVWLLTVARVRAYFLFGLILGFLLFDVVFYASVMVTGVNVVEALGWPAVLIGNLIAGVLLVEYVRLSCHLPGVGVRQILREHRVLREGLVSGLLGAGAVAISFLILDFLFRAPLYTPAALGSALIYGAEGPEQVAITAATVGAYTVLHFIAFFGIGLAAAAFATEAEDHPTLLLGFVLVFATFEALFIGLVALVALWVLDALGWWNVLVGNVVAAVVMVGFLWREHPSLVQLLRKGSLEVPV